MHANNDKHIVLIYDMKSNRQTKQRFLLVCCILYISIRVPIKSYGHQGFCRSSQHAQF